MSELDAKPHLTQLPLLARMSPEAKDKIAQLFLDTSDNNTYEDGEALMSAGYLSFDTGYVLWEGHVAIESESGETVAEVAAPATMGEMSQFSSGDTRNATVRAIGEAHALRFSWEDLYAEAQESLSKEENAAFRGALEELVWDRFPEKSILSLAMFNDLSDATKTQVCIPLPWITEVVNLKPNETLFKEGVSCNETGFLLLDGALNLARTGKGEKIVASPDIVGIFPAKSEEPPKWSATAIAIEPARILQFSWGQYTRRLAKRLSKDDQKALIQSIKNNASKHFWH